MNFSQETKQGLKCPIWQSVSPTMSTEKTVKVNREGMVPVKTWGHLLAFRLLLPKIMSFQTKLMNAKWLLLTAFLALYRSLAGW